MIEKEHTFLFYDEMNEVGYVACSVKANVLVLEHVVVHDEYRGKGYASAMMELLISHLTKQKITFSCTCSYAVSWMEKHDGDNRDMKL